MSGDAVDLESLPADELLAVARHAVTLLVDRLSEPEAVHDLEPMMPRPAASDWAAMLPEPAADTPMASADPEETGGDQSSEAEGSTPADAKTGAVPDCHDDPPHPRTLPCLHRDSEALGRVVESLLTVLAGHTDRLFVQSDQRQVLLGLPAGRCAFRDSSEYLREHLDITRGQARARVARAHQLMPRTAPVTGEWLGPRMSVLAEAVRAGQVGMVATDAVASTLTEARREAVLAGVDHHAVAELIADGERLLTEQATAVDPDSLRKVCARWTQWAQAMINPDGVEPTDAQKNHHQGLFYKGRKAGLHQWLLNANDLQHEVLSTVGNAAANPRSAQTASEGTSAAASTDSAAAAADEAGPADASADGPAAPDALSDADGATGLEGTTDPSGAEPVTSPEDLEPLDDRSRAQRQLDGLVAALTGALSMVEGSGLPDSGGVRPQVLVTIDYQQLLSDLGRTSSTGRNHRISQTDRTNSPDEDDGFRPLTDQGGAPPGHGPPPGAWPAQRTAPPEDSGGMGGPGRAGWFPVSEAVFSGPISPTTIRAIACDAALIPVVLGSAGEVLDLGRSQRLFTPRLRRAIIARDGGCAATGCTMPAPWCHVHHVQEWEHGGPTSVECGVILCSHHHLAVHSGAWSIDMASGRPWFIPAPYLDPQRTPRRNRYWRSR